MKRNDLRNRPIVYLIGAGPGDPNYLTLRGAECLGRADVVLYDYLVNPAVLQHVRPDAELICLGRHGRGKRLSQEEINDRILLESAAGKIVARLKSGDPAVFACGAQEAELLSEQEIPFEIVPGITAALASGSCAGIPITHRDHASAVALITGQERSGKESEAIDYEALASFPGTIVMYMGVTTVERWSSDLLRAGKPADTPVAVVRRCSWADQVSITCSLGDVAERISGPNKLRPPIVFIIGHVVELAKTLSWFEQRPLFGQTVMVTRPQHQAENLARQFEELGARVVQQPAITISEPPSWDDVDAAISRLDSYDWLVFSSANGVDFFLKRLFELGLDARSLGRCKIAAIGPGTASRLKDHHLIADLVPEKFEAETLATELAGEAAQCRYLLLRASRGREVLKQTLEQAGGQVDQVVVYTSDDITQANEELLSEMKEGAIDWVTITSSAIAKSMASMFGESLNQTHLASISPITTATLDDLGYRPTTEATTYTMPGIVESILNSKQSKE